MLMFLNRIRSCESGASGASGVEPRSLIVAGFTDGEWNDPPLKNITNRGAFTKLPPAT
jgi:hypothetical protein